MGPITQIIFYYLIYLFFTNGYIFEHTFLIFKKINYFLISFNLLPIIPLDGSKLTSLIFEKFFSYKLANKLNILISFIVVSVLIVYLFLNKYNMFFILIFLLLIKNIYLEIKNLNFKFNKFLLERHLYSLKFNKNIVINSINQVKRNKNFNIIHKNKVLSEETFLNHFFSL